MPVPLIATAVIGGGALLARKGAKEASAAETRAEEFARAQADEAKAEQARLEEKFGMTPGELEREELAFATEQIRINEAKRRTGVSGEELLREAGPETRKLLDTVATRFGKTGEELFRGEGELPRALQEQILAETEEPGKFFEDTFQQELELVRQEVNKEAQRRGVFGGLPEGGIRFEQLGRAGVELAIKSAKEKTAQRQQSLSNAFQLSTQFQELSAIARGEAGTVGERSIAEQERARAELDSLLGNIQQLSAGARGRAAEVGLTAATGVREPALAREADIIAAIEGGRIGRGEAKEQAGLDLIGQGTSILSGGLPTTTPTSTGGPAPSSAEFLFREQRKKRLSGLPEFTGASNLQIS